MDGRAIGVGIIGVNPDRGRAATAHIPALRALPAYEIRALTASSRTSAGAAGKAFGVAVALSDHTEYTDLVPCNKQARYLTR